MNSYNMSSWLIILMISAIRTVDAQNNNFIITKFGGVGDGKTDNKEAFVNAWKKACGINGGTISVPKGTFFVSRGDFQGPCVGRTQLNIDGTIIARSGDDASVVDEWISFYQVDGLTISGTGTVDGNGASAWSRCVGSEKCGNRPTSLKLAHVTNTIIKDISLVNSKMFQMVIHESEYVTVGNVHITAPDESPNTDGIHIGHSNYVNIMDSNIGTGDDCVSLGDGSKNVNVSGVFCGPGHGISIGSLGKYKGEEDVSGITVRNCTLTKTDNGLRIKTWAPSQSSIIVSDVTFADIILKSVDNPIIIDQYYCPSGSCVQNGESNVEIRGVKYVNIRGTSTTAKAVNIQCSKSKPCKDINLVGVKITYNGKQTSAICSNEIGVQFQGSSQLSSRCPVN